MRTLLSLLCAITCAASATNVNGSAHWPSAVRAESTGLSLVEEQTGYACLERSGPELAAGGQHRGWYLVRVHNRCPYPVSYKVCWRQERYALRNSSGWMNNSGFLKSGESREAAVVREEFRPYGAVWHVRRSGSGDPPLPRCEAGR